MDQTKFEIVGIKLGSQGLDVFKWKQKEVPSLSSGGMRPAEDLRLEEGMMFEVVLKLDLRSLYRTGGQVEDNLIENIMFR